MTPRGELEAAVLCVMLDDGGAARASAEVEPGWFVERGRREAFEAACRIHRRGERVTSLGWAREWAAGTGTGWGDRAEALAGLLEHSVGCRENLPTYAGMMRELAARDAMAAEAENVAAATDPTVDPGETVARLEGLQRGMLPARGSQAARDMIASLIGSLDSPSLQRANLATPWAGLDALIGGLPAGLIVLAARTSQGKSALAMNLATQAALDGVPVRVASLEMTSEALLERSLAYVAQVPVRGVNHSDFEIAALRDAATRLHEAGERLRFLDTRSGPWTVEWLSAAMERSAPVGLAVVDYLQLMSARGQTRYEQLGQIMAGLRAMAARLGCPVVVLSQLNREADKRSDHRPQLSDLRDSGNIEEAADLVLLLHRPGYHDPNADPTAAELLVAKNREGRTGLVKLRWTAQTTTFLDA